MVIKCCCFLTPTRLFCPIFGENAIIVFSIFVILKKSIQSHILNESFSTWLYNKSIRLNGFLKIYITSLWLSVICVCACGVCVRTYDHTREPALDAVPRFSAEGAAPPLLRPCVAVSILAVSYTVKPSVITLQNYLVLISIYIYIIYIYFKWPHIS